MLVNSDASDNTRVLFYSHFFWPSVGGVETYAKALAEGLALMNGLHVAVATQTPSEDCEPEWSFALHRRPRLHQLWSLIKESDVVLMAGPVLLPMILAILARKPFLVEQHGYQAICPNGLLLNRHRQTICKGAFSQREYGECFRCLRVNSGPIQSVRQIVATVIRNRLCRNAFRHIAVTNHVNNRHQFPRTEVVYHGVPDRRGAIGSNAIVSHAQRIHFAYVGRFVEEKGVHLLIEAASRVKAKGLDCKVSLIGDGPLKSHLLRLANGLNMTSSVKITGFLDGPDLQRALQLVDVVVMPSVCEETAGLSAMEQMMRGRAVLVADIGGLGEVVSNAGLKFRPFDAVDLAEKMAEIIRSPSLIDEIGIVARKRATTYFQLKRMVEEHKELLIQASQKTRHTVKTCPTH